MNVPCPNCKSDRTRPYFETALFNQPYKKYECLACKAVFVYDTIRKPLKTQRDGGVQ